jgi:hypothetical protein
MMQIATRKAEYLQKFKSVCCPNCFANSNIFGEFLYFKNILAFTTPKTSKLRHIGRFFRFVFANIMVKKIVDIVHQIFLEELKAFPSYITNLTSVKIYNLSMFFKILPKRIRKTLFNIRALSLFGLFFITRLTPRASNFSLIPEK